MKQLILLLIALGVNISEAQELTDVDRDLLLDRLKEIQESANNASRGKFSAALSAFRAAATSDNSTHDLFLQCVEKVQFKDEAKKAKDFREWRKRHKDNRDGPGFRRALRYQLNWLIKTIEVSQNPDSKERMPEVAISAIESILGDAKILEGQKGILQADVLGSIFAQAYELRGVSTENWSNAPFQISSMYEDVILPPWQDPEKITMLKKGWDKRIEHTGLAIKLFNVGRNDDRIPEFEKWMDAGRLDLLWSKQIDLFKNGDQRASALAMLDQVKANLVDERAKGWILDFTNLIEGKKLKRDEEKEAAE